MTSYTVPVPKSASGLDLFKDVLTGAVYPESAWFLATAHNPPRLSWRPPALKAFIQFCFMNGIVNFLTRRGLLVVEPRNFNADARNLGQDWPLFGYTMIGRRRLDHLQHCIGSIIRENVPGDMLEAGVWRGGAVMFMKAVLNSLDDKQRVLWLADTFKGLPPPRFSGDGTDLSSNAFLAVDRQKVAENFERFGLLDERVRFLEGLFENTLPSAPVASLALLRLDGDLYSSTKDALVSLYPRVSPGGYVIVDDYHSWPGCRQAVHDYLTAIGQSPEILPIDQHAVYWRIPRETSFPLSPCEIANPSRS